MRMRISHKLNMQEHIVSMSLTILVDDFHMYTGGFLINANLVKEGRFVSLNHNIFIVADHTPVDVDHAAHSGCPTIFNQRIMTTHLL